MIEAVTEAGVALLAVPQKHETRSESHCMSRSIQSFEGKREELQRIL